MIQSFAFVLLQLAQFNPEWIPAAMAAGGILVNVGVHLATVRVLNSTVAEHTRKIDKNRNAIILISPEQHRANVLQILSEEK